MFDSTAQVLNLRIFKNAIRNAFARMVVVHFLDAADGDLRLEPASHVVRRASLTTPSAADNSPRFEQSVEDRIVDEPDAKRRKVPDR